MATKRITKAERAIVELNQKFGALIELMTPQSAIVSPGEQFRAEPPQRQGRARAMRGDAISVRSGRVSRSSERSAPRSFSPAELARAEDDLFNPPMDDETSPVPTFEDRGLGPELMGANAAADNPDSIPIRLKQLELGEEVLAQRFQKLEQLVKMIVDKLNGAPMGANMGR